MGLLRDPGRKEGRIMDRTFRAVLAVFFIAIITFCGITLCQKLGWSWKLDLTDQRLFSLSKGTKSIIGKLNQPINIDLYYSRTAAMKAPDPIRYYNEYYHYVEALLQEYLAASNGMINLEVIDPRPYSDDEQEAIRYRLKRFPITEEENFFFGLVIKTQYGAFKTIDFFTPDRHNFIEYDISYLLDSVITRKKSRIGILSSLAVLGDDVTGYMAQMMRMQGQRPKPAWDIVDLLRQRYEVERIDPDTEEIKGIDLLMVVHPKAFPEKTLFAIDQFVLKGGRTVVLVDPFCLADEPPPQSQMQGRLPERASDLNRLLKTWGVEMPADTFAGDKSLAPRVSLRQNQRPQKLIGFLDLKPGCFNSENIISANLNQVRVFFSGVIETDEDSKSQIVPILQTTSEGNSWKPESPFELMMFDGKTLMRRFRPGSKPVTLATLITGKFLSSFPEGIDVPEESEESKKQKAPGVKSSETPKMKHISGLKEAKEEGAVLVFADADFISDSFAFQRSLFGVQKVGDNSALLMNAIENLLGSGDLISIRTRGNFQRPFALVEEIEKEAEKETAQEETRVNDEIVEFQRELNKVVSDARSTGETVIDASELSQTKTELEIKIHEAKVRLREVQRMRRERIERLGTTLRNVNMLLAPVVILCFAIVLSIRRRRMRSRYISHASD